MLVKRVVSQLFEGRHRALEERVPAPLRLDFGQDYPPVSDAVEILAVRSRGKNLLLNRIRRPGAMQPALWSFRAVAPREGGAGDDEKMRNVVLGDKRRAPPRRTGLAGGVGSGRRACVPGYRAWLPEDSGVRCQLPTGASGFFAQRRQIAGSIC